jgi:hypothetical protein
MLFAETRYCHVPLISDHVSEEFPYAGWLDPASRARVNVLHVQILLVSIPLFLLPDTSLTIPGHSP